MINVRRVGAAVRARVPQGLHRPLAAREELAVPALQAGPP
jgi:hypothetical protein